MAKEFTFHCGASSLVDDNYIKYDIKGNNVAEVWYKAVKYAEDSKVLDGGSVDCEMDTRELAIALGNLASNNYDEWEPTMLLEELNNIKANCPELMCTLENIVCKEVK